MPGTGAFLHHEHPAPGCMVPGASCTYLEAAHPCTVSTPNLGAWCRGHHAGGCLEWGHPCTSGTPGRSRSRAPCCTGGILCRACPAPRPPAPSQPMPYLGASTRQQHGVCGTSGEERIYSVRRVLCRDGFVLYEATPRQGGQQRGAAPALRAMQNAIPPPSFCTRGLLAAAL